jgi:hypothetical protein
VAPKRLSISPSPRASRGCVVLWGLLGSYPFGGMTWQVLHHLAGFRALGFDVWYVEDSDRYVYDADTFVRTKEAHSNVEFVQRQLERIGLGDRWAFRLPHSDDEYAGALDAAGVRELYRSADAVFNLCGAQELRPEHDVISCLVLLETDPVASQVAVARGDRDRIEELDRYDMLFTYGANLGAPDCRVPVERYAWHPTRPPVVVDWWRDGARPSREALTTVAKWRHKGKDVVWQGERWRWSKHWEFHRFLDLPQASVLPLEVAISAIGRTNLKRLRDLGWRTLPSERVSEPDAYRIYIRESLGEFSVAKDQYVAPRSGWFSDRTVCYLAAGRPAVVQETGFSESVPTGDGLLSFSDRDEALAAVADVAAAYHRHSTAAAELAAGCFDARVVLGDVVRRVGLL